MPMSILASVCWKAGSVWLCCGRVCGIPRVVACLRGRVWVCARLFVWLRVCAGLARACCRVCARACVCGLVWRVGVGGGGRACVRGPPWWCVVAVSYSPAPPGVQYHWRGRA